ncbi:MAG: ATP-binding protein [Chloroflexota bacterium]|nr:ATP-binding protein [Chloroflexota bacterium]
MLTRTIQFLAAPVFEDKDKTRIASLLNTILLATLAIVVIYGLVSLVVYSNPMPVLMSIGLVVLLTLSALLMTRRGHVQLASVVLSFVLWVVITFGSFAFGGVQGPGLSGYSVVILIAGLLLGGRVGIGFAGLSIVGGLGMLFAEINGLTPPSLVTITPVHRWIVLTTVLIVAAVLLQLATSSINDALERARRYAARLEEQRERLAEERNLLRTLIDALPDFIYVKDTEGRFALANVATAHNVGLTAPDEIIGKTGSDLGLPGSAEQCHVLEQQVMRSGQAVVNVEEVRIDPAGNEEWGLTDKVPLRDTQGKIVGLVNITRDVTEIKRTEEVLRERTEALERSNRELEQLAYVASHDLQEPLRMVTSYLQLIERRYKGSLDSDADEFIAFAVDGAARMQGLINDLLIYSRVGTRGKPFELTDCSAVLNRALANLQVAIEENGAVVTHGTLPTVMADETQLVRVFQNLIGNAIKFRSDLAPEIHVEIERNDGEWLFSVRDNGIGMAPQYFERIFVIFQRLHNRSEYSGTGIGLAVCKKIVERHGGRIWVTSEPEKGSTFYFTIPDRGDDLL